MNEVHPQSSSKPLALATAALVIGALLVGCGHAQQPSAPPTSASTSTSAEVSPSEKAIDPTGGNKFTPAQTAPAAPTVPAGQHPGINGIP